MLNLIAPFPAAETTDNGDTGPPAYSTTVIRLRHIRPLASGSQRQVFDHPSDSNLLIKVMREPFGTPPWYRRRLKSRYGKFRSALREIEEYVALQAGAPGNVDLVERVAGLVETDMGLGLAVEALRGRDGTLAPTLHDILKRGGFTPDVAAKLDRFLARVLGTDLVAYDTKARNIVFAHDPATGEDRFVLVDGMGERLTLKLNVISRRLNRFNKGRRVNRLRREIERILAARPRRKG
jgi:hypothetical protein